MSAGRNLPLVIICLVLIGGSSPLPTTSQVPGTNPMRPLTPRRFATEDLALPTEDYSQYVDPVTSIIPDRVPPHGGSAERCDYNPCLESQIPCVDLAASTGCLCPGLTSHTVAPEAPNLKSVSWNGSQVVIQWCAPHSYVTSYYVTLEGEQRLMFGRDKRSVGVGDMDHITQVCVTAVNDAGESKESCLMYQPKDSSLPLKAGLIGGALGLLLLILLAVLLWRHRRQRKQEASISMHDAAEAQ